MCSSLLQLALGSCDLSQSEKELTACKDEKIINDSKMNLKSEKINFPIFAKLI